MAKVLNDAGEGGSAGLHDLACEDVSINDGNGVGSVGAEEGGDGGFAGGDSACQTDVFFGDEEGVMCVFLLRVSVDVPSMLKVAVFLQV